MRTRRIIFGTCMLLLLVSGLYSGERLFYAAFAAMVLMLLLSAGIVIHTAITFKYLESLSPSSAVKGDTVEYVVEVHNDFILPIPYLKLYYETVDTLLSGNTATMTLSLMPMTHAERRESMVCKYRGTWQVGVRQVEIRDFFGLIRICLDVKMFLSHKPRSLLVRPRIVPLVSVPGLRIKGEGSMESAPRRTDETAMLSDTRKYLAGDSMKRIHWKLTARQREVMVKNYEETSLPDLMLYIDAAEQHDAPLDRLSSEDTLVECAAALSFYLLQHRMPVSLIQYSEDRLQLTGYKQEDFTAFHDALSVMSFTGKYPLEDVLMNDRKAIMHSGNLFIITPDISNRLFNLMMLLASSGVSVTLVYVYKPEAERLAAAGRPYELAQARRRFSELRNAGVTVIDLHAGETIAERIAGA